MTCRVGRLLAVLSLGILPPGVMPGRSADGGIEMVLCSDDGAVVMVLPPVTGVTRPKPDRTSAGRGRSGAPALANDIWRPAHDPRGLYPRGRPDLV